MSILRRFCTILQKHTTSRQEALQSCKLQNRGIKMTSKSGDALKKLEEFGYAFNKDGQLRKLDKQTGKLSDEPYSYDVYNGNRDKNEAHYQQLADQIPEIVYDLLEQAGLERTYVPENLPKEQATFIFTQPKPLQSSDKLLVLIHGSGYVRAGQWARSLIINNSLDHGTQLPYIKKAQQIGYDLLITNTNDNYREVDGKRQAIPGLNSASAHAAYVWENYVMASQPKSVAIVAHSYGGAITIDLAKRFPKFFKDHVFAIALTDSAHHGVSDDVAKIIGNITCNWVSSDEPLDTKISNRKGDMLCVSAGHSKHEWTSYAAFSSVFKFLDEKYADFKAKAKSAKKPKLDDN